LGILDAPGIPRSFMALPAYAGARARQFSSDSSIYGATGANLATARTKLAKAKVSAGMCKIIVIGDSKAAGYGVASPWASSWPMQLRGLLSTAGYPVAGTGFVYCVGWNSNGPDTRWVYAGGFAAIATNHHAQSNTNGATATYTPNGSDPTGTSVDVAYVPVNGASFTISVDGASSGAGFQTVSPGANGSATVVTLSGLSDTRHTVVITTTSANQTNILGVRQYNANGVEVTNAAVSSTRTSHWSPTSGGSSPYNLHRTTSFYAPDIVFIELGTNDAYLNAVTLANFTTFYKEIIAAWQALGATVIPVISGPSNPTISATANLQTYWSAIYDAADTYNTPVIDFADRMSGASYAVANTAGMMQGDGIHETAAGLALKGQAAYSILR